jgi:hypothetical protein
VRRVDALECASADYARRRGAYEREAELCRAAVFRVGGGRPAAAAPAQGPGRGGPAEEAWGRIGLGGGDSAGAAGGGEAVTFHAGGPLADASAKPMPPRRVQSARAGRSALPPRRDAAVAAGPDERGGAPLSARPLASAAWAAAVASWPSLAAAAREVDISAGGTRPPQPQPPPRVCPQGPLLGLLGHGPERSQPGPPALLLGPPAPVVGVGTGMVR